MANVLSKVRVFYVIFSFMNDFNHGHLNPKKMEGGREVGCGSGGQQPLRFGGVLDGWNAE